MDRIIVVPHHALLKNISDVKKEAEFKLVIIKLSYYFQRMWAFRYGVTSLEGIHQITCGFLWSPKRLHTTFTQ